MAAHGVTSAFASHAFLKGLQERHLMILASGAKPFHAEPGELLASEGDTARSFYLIQSGHVILGLHRPHQGSLPVQVVGPGDVVGWSWLVEPHRWKFECRARDAVEGIVFDGSWLRDQCERNYELGYLLLKQLLSVTASRLAATRLQLLEASHGK